MADKLHTKINISTLRPFPLLGDSMPLDMYGDERGRLVCPHCKAVEKVEGDVTNMPHLFGVITSSNLSTGEIVTAVQARVCEGDENSNDMEHVPLHVQNGDFHHDTVGLYLCRACNHFFAVNSCRGATQ